MLFQKLNGEKLPLPARHSYSAIALAWLGAFLAIAVVAGLANQLDLTLILGSFGASCVLVFAYPDVPFSQPRNVIFGHVLSSLIGLTCITVLGPGWLSLAIAVASAIAAMMVTRTVHPPAGSNPVIVFLAQPGWSFLWFPTLTGACLIVLVALLYNNMTRKTNYPKYW